jgi:hypothetical protein
VGKSRYEELSRFFEELRKKNPDKVNQILDSENFEELGDLKDFVEYKKEAYKKFVQEPRIKEKAERIKELYGDLLADGFFNLDYKTFSKSAEASSIDGQTREEIVSRLKKLEGMHYYKGTFKATEIYISLYENLCKFYLAEIAGWIKNRPVENCGKIIKTINEYEDGKYESLFTAFKPQIRNSIGHKDFYVDKEKPLIIFKDKNKPPLEISPKEFNQLIWDSLFLNIAFDVAQFELKEPIYQDLVSIYETVLTFIKKKGLTLKKGGSITIPQLFEFVKNYKKSKERR